MTSRPIVITPLAAVLFGAIPFAACALVGVVVLAPRLGPPHHPFPPMPPLASMPAAMAPALPPGPMAATAEPASPLAPTVIVMTRHGEILQKMEADDDACHVYAQSSVDMVARAMAGTSAAAEPGNAAAAAEALQKGYNTAYARCMISRGYVIKGYGPPQAPAKFVPPAPRVEAVVPPPPPVLLVIPHRPLFRLLPPPPPRHGPAVVFVP